MIRSWMGYLALGSVLAAPALLAQSTPTLQIASVDELLVELEFTAGQNDVQLQSSADAGTWNVTNFFIPADRTLSFPHAKPADGVGFFKLVPAPPDPLLAAVPDIANTTLGSAGFSTYHFRTDGTGLVALEQDGGLPTAYYDFLWTVLETQPGMVTVRTDSADGYVEILNLQFLVSGTVYTFITSSEGPGGAAFSLPYSFAARTMPAGVGTAPPTLDATAWTFSRTGEPDATGTFAAGGSATGPNLATGSMTTWTFSYIPTGSNTATLAVTDTDGNFGRFFLIFEPSGDVARFGFSSSSVATLFGSGSTMGDFVRQ